MKAILTLVLISLTSINTFAQNQLPIVPYPLKVILGEGYFITNEQTAIIATQEALPVSDLLAEALSLKYTSDPSHAHLILFENDAFLPKEAYEIAIDSSRILVSASSETGHFYAFQTLMQIMDKNKRFPQGSISDEPRFAHRGIMLDVSRHFMPKSFVKKLINVMSVYKLNKLHWHLTDDQGWRIEIKQYPKLTEVGSTRKESMKGHYTNNEYDGIPHGGFYTQEDIKEIVAYAASKQVEIIPEIEMPGHAVAALTSYPELGCSGGPYEVRTEWGVATDVFCPYEDTFTFLENVLTEVMELFPSKYIHIGGDECPKDSWKASEFCQNLIKEKELGDEHGLQSYFITRIDNFLSSKGRKIIGWDEILEGGLSPNATVMSWRGMAGGVEAAKQGHDVIMTPNSHVYLDYYQGNPDTEPLAIGGYLPLEKTYSLEPVASELSQEEEKYILGVQGNLWTEYVKDPKKAEYMLFPRALAVAEIGWTPKAMKSYPQFVKRVQSQFDLLDELEVNYATSMYSMNMELLESEAGKVKIGLTTAIPNTEIRYTTDGTDPDINSINYTKAGVSLSKSSTIKAALFSNGKMMGNIFIQKINVNLLTGLAYETKFKTTKYTGGSNYALSDGIKGKLNKLDEWVGLNGEDLNVVFELPTLTKIKSIKASFIHAPSSWIMLPKHVKVYGSKDGQNYSLIGGNIIPLESNQESRLEDCNISVKRKKIKFLKIEAENYGPLPESHPGKGSPAWLFVDEIEAE